MPTRTKTRDAQQSGDACREEERPDCFGRVRVVVDRSPDGELAVLDLSVAQARSFEPVLDCLRKEVEEEGSPLPVVAVREVVENLVHACCRDAVVTMCEHATVLIVSDHGPGIADPQKALLPGCTTAAANLRGVIRGAGLGLPRAYDAMSRAGGSLAVDANLGGGTVVTLALRAADQHSSSLSRAPRAHAEAPAPLLPLTLSSRHKQILMLLADRGSAGPSAVASALQIGLSTAFRELSDLERLGLAYSLGKGKRALTERAAANWMDLLKTPP